MKPNFTVNPKRETKFTGLLIAKIVVFIGLLVCVINKNWIVLSILTLFTPLLFIHEGVIFYNDTYFEFTSILGFKFGKHKNTPPILYVLVRDIRFVHRGGSGSDGDTYEEMYEIALVCEPRERIVVLHTYVKSDVRLTASKAAKFFNTEIYDSTEEQIMMSKTRRNRNRAD